MKKRNKIFSILLIVFLSINFIFANLNIIGASEFRNEGNGEYSNTLVNKEEFEDLPLGIHDFFLEDTSDSKEHLDFQNEDNRPKYLEVEKIWVDSDFQKEIVGKVIVENNPGVVTVENPEIIDGDGVITTPIMNYAETNLVKEYDSEHISQNNSINDTIDNHILDEFPLYWNKAELISEIGSYKIRGTKLGNEDIPEKVDLVLWVDGDKTENIITLSNKNDWKGKFELEDSYFDDFGRLKDIMVLEKDSEAISYPTPFEASGKIEIDGKEFNYWSIVKTDGDELEAKIVNYKPKSIDEYPERKPTIKVKKVWVDCDYSNNFTGPEIIEVDDPIITVSPGPIIVDGDGIVTVDEESIISSNPPIIIDGDGHEVTTISEASYIDSNKKQFLRNSSNNKLNIIDEFYKYEITGTELKDNEIPVDSITVELYKDGKPTNKKVELSKENNWEGEIDISEYLHEINPMTHIFSLVEIDENSEGNLKYQIHEDDPGAASGEVVLNGEKFNYWSKVNLYDYDFEAKIFNYRETCKANTNPPEEPRDKHGNKPGEPILDKTVPTIKSTNKSKDDTNKEEKNLEKLDIKNHIQYIQGYKDGKLKPENKITREEVAAVFYRILDENYRNQIKVSVHSYSDFDRNRWSSKHIGTLSNGGILEGYPGNEFRPSNNITRAEVAAIASRFDDLEETNKSKFLDVNGHWAEKYIDSAEKKGWINGYPDGTFKPNQEITRAEFVTLVNKVLNRKVNRENILDNIQKFDDLDSQSWYYEDMVEATNSHIYKEKRLKDNSEIWEKIIYPDIDM